VFNSAISAFALVFGAVIISTVALYLIGRLMEKMEKRNRMRAYLFIAVALVVTALAAYLFMYGFSRSSWSGVDELAFNYYASYLFIHGVNPYTQSMQPIISQRGIVPSLLVNGTYEYAYDYPALSFLAYVPITALGITNFFSFIFVLVFLSIVAAFAVYQSSGFSKKALLPAAAWLGLSYSLVSVSNTYLAVSVFLLFAYLYRKKSLLAGAFLGLAASTTQLAWFALPFFYVLTLKEDGLKKAAKRIAVSVLVFLAINSYFIALSPRATLVNMFALFGTSKLPFYGPNLMEYLLAYYPVPYAFSTIISVISLLFALVVFYFYQRSAHYILAIVPMFIFFLSWRSISIYSISYVPLLLALLYSDKEEKARGTLKNANLIPIGIVALVILFAVIAVLMHASYAKQDTLQINRIMPVVYTSQQYFSLGSIFVNVTNNGNANETVTFDIASRSPNQQAYVLGSTLSQLAPGQSFNYQINFQLPLVNNNTRLFVFAFSKDYTAHAQLNFSLNYSKA